MSKKPKLPPMPEIAPPPTPPQMASAPGTTQTSPMGSFTAKPFNRPLSLAMAGMFQQRAGRKSLLGG